MFPADVRILQSKDLFVSQAALTGESLPVEKFPHPSKPDMHDALELECLRNRTAGEIRNALPVRRGMLFYEGESHFPVITGDPLPDHPMRLIERGHFHSEVELLYGHNRDESSIFLLFAYPLLMTRGLVRNFLEETLGKALSSQMWTYYVEDQRQWKESQQRQMGAADTTSTPSSVEPMAAASSAGSSGPRKTRDAAAAASPGVKQGDAPAPWNFGDVWERALNYAGGGGTGAKSVFVPADVGASSSATATRSAVATATADSLRMQVVRMLNDMW